MAQKVHFSGIGGTAMVGGARLALELGYEVRGSDNPLYPPTSHMVQTLNIPLYEGYQAANLEWGPDSVVIGNALSRGNPEVEAVVSKRIRYLSLPEWLKDAVLRPRLPIAICGTHGKTTTTALTAFILKHTTRGTGWLVGGDVPSLGQSAHLGATSGFFIIEGDEYDSAFFDKRAKFLHYLPVMAIVTSLEFDHGDIYNSLEEIEIAFQRMFRQIPEEGTIFLCADNHAMALAGHAYSKVRTYGFAQTADWRIAQIKSDPIRSRYEIWQKDTRWGIVSTSLLGQHNAQNVLAAIAVTASCGIAAKDIIAAVEAFPGVRRRMEIFIDLGNVIFVDDFAHHPTAIRETVAAAKKRWPDRRLRALFEPRSNTVVTNRFQQDLSKAFVGADEVCIGPIYRAQSIPLAKRLDRDLLVEQLNQQGIPARSFDDVESLVNHVLDTMKDHELILVMSNGAFGGIYDMFRERLGISSNTR